MFHFVIKRSNFSKSYCFVEFPLVLKYRTTFILHA